MILSVLVPMILIVVILVSLYKIIVNIIKKL